MVESGRPRAPGNGVTPADLRRVNERVVLEAMADDADLWRVADLMRATGLTRVTVVDVLRGLQDKEWVGVEPMAPGGRGRPATGFRRRVPPGLAAGLDLGAHRVRASVADLAGHVLARGSATVTPDLPRADRLAVGQRVLTEAVGQVPAGGADPDRSRTSAELWSVVAATTGTVTADGQVLRSAAITDWAGLDLAREFTDRVGVPVEVRNDIQLVGAAEQQWGAGAEADHIMLLWLGRRPAVSLVLDGRPYAGAHGVAGDLSRSGLLPEEAAWQGGGAWLDLAGTTGAPGVDPFDAALSAAEAGDAEAIGAFTAWFERLAPVVSLFAAVVDPDVIILGGPIATLGERLSPILAADLGRHLQERPRIAVSGFGAEAVADAAARTAARRVFERLLDNDGRGAAPLRRSELVDRDRPAG